MNGTTNIISQKEPALGERSIPTVGKLVTWRAQDDTDVDKLREEFSKIKSPYSKEGLERFTPSYNSPQLALSLALKKHYSGHSHKVISIKGEQGYAVMKIILADESETQTLETQWLFEARVENSTSTIPDFIEIENGALPPHLKDDIIQSMRDFLTKCNGHALKTKLVEIVHNLHGTPVSSNGGMYWLPDKSLDVWEQVTAAVGNCGSNWFGGFYFKYTDEAQITILKQFKDNIESKAAAVLKDAIDPNKKMGEKACQTQAANVRQLVSMMKMYEEVFGANLQALGPAIQQVKTALNFRYTAAMEAKREKEKVRALKKANRKS